MQEAFKEFQKIMSDIIEDTDRKSFARGRIRGAIAVILQLDADRDHCIKYLASATGLQRAEAAKIIDALMLSSGAIGGEYYA